jgi:CheY-like chemotaxis protein
MNHINARVLLVDDNKDAVDMVSQLLSLYHIDHRVAYDGASAVALLADWPADIVFLDIQMPDMDGYETATAMHALPQCAELPIVAWTGWDGPGSREAMARAHNGIPPDEARSRGRIAGVDIALWQQRLAPIEIACRHLPTHVFRPQTALRYAASSRDR